MITKFIDTTKGMTENKTVFTAFLNDSKWYKNTGIRIDSFEEIKYLGRCKEEGDMFAGLLDGKITILKGIKGNEFN